MNKLFEKNRKLIPLSAVALVVLSSLIEVILLLVAPESLISSTVPKIIFSTTIKFIMSAIFIFIILKLYKLKIGFGKKSLVKGIFWFGSMLCIASMFNFLGGYQNPEINFIQALPMIIMFLVFALSVGLYEEIVFRGLIFGLFRKYFGESKKGIYTSVLLSALIFGCVHFLNLIVYPGLIITTIAQVISASFVGVLFAVIYFRTENLLPCIILHTIFDFAGYFWFSFAKDIDKMMNVANTTDTNIGAGIINIALCSLFVISGLLQLRKVFKNKKLNSIEDKR